MIKSRVFSEVSRNARKVKVESLSASSGIRVAGILLEANLAMWLLGVH